MRDFFERLLKTIIGLLVLVLLIVFVFPVVLNIVVQKNSAEPNPKAATWMKSLDDSLKLNEISIPGTHNSATQNCDIPFFSVCQTFSVNGQLYRGYRYLDIRLAIDTDEKSGEKSLKFVHGPSTCRSDIWPWSKPLTVDMVLEDIYEFIATHPTETVLFVVKPENEQDDITEFETLLNTYITKNSSKWLLTDDYPTLEEARGKIVLFRRYEDKASLGKTSGISLIWEDQKGVNADDAPYEMNLLNKHALFVQDHYEYGNNLKWNAFYYGFSNPGITENGDAFINFLSTKGRFKYGHPLFHSFVLNRRFKDAQMESGRNYGWIVLDYGTEELAIKIYETNYGH